MSNDSLIEYTVLVHDEDGAYWAEVEELPGCFAAGDSEEELWESVADAITAYLSTDESPLSLRVMSRTRQDTTERVGATLASC